MLLNEKHLMIIKRIRDNYKSREKQARTLLDIVMLSGIVTFQFYISCYTFNSHNATENLKSDVSSKRDCEYNRPKHIKQLFTQTRSNVN